MLQHKQEEAAMIAASKRIASNESKSTAGEAGPPDEVRRNFVLSASGFRRSRGKTSPMISPIEDVEKFIRENQEAPPEDPDNVRRTESKRKPTLFLTLSLLDNHLFLTLLDNYLLVSLFYSIVLCDMLR
jgi:hypothetical protein